MPNSPRQDAAQSTQGNETFAHWRTVRGYLVLPHFVAIMVVELATLAFATIAWHGVPPLRLLAPLLFAMLGGQLVIGVTNEIVDYADDAVHKPSKPLPRGDVSMRGAKVMLLIGLAMMVCCGVALGWPSFVLLVAGSGLGVAYDLWLKRTRWSWLPYLLALPLLPIWVFVTLGRAVPALLLLYPLGALAAIGVHFAQALPDVASDRAAGLVTATSRLGARRVYWLAWIAALSAPALARLAAGWLEIHGGREIPVATAATVALLLFDVALLTAKRRVAYRWCFPLVAFTTVINGVAWVLVVAR
jgi:4-hydroxybenzoate polyprenyltransferase